MKASCKHRSRWRSVPALVLGLPALGCAAVMGAPPTGSEEQPSPEEAEAMKAIGTEAGATIVWSSSRLGNHDLFTMTADGSNIKPLTRGEAVDWFPRYSPDGSRILFCRSKKGWVSERDANDSDKWDIYTIATDGSDPTLVVESASWGTWINDAEILFVRGTKLFRGKLGSSDYTELFDSETVEALDGALVQQPQLSPDGRYIAITLRGSKRETGIWDLEKKTWSRTGLGCQINWTPDGSAIYWVNPTGNGGSEVFKLPITDGKPPAEVDDDRLGFIDIPGRRSHEYFPELSDDGQWLVWAATQRGHDHDTADYEIYLWRVGRDADAAVRLTFHSSNDRWPDILLPGEGKAKVTASEEGEASKEAGAPEGPSLKSAAAKDKKKRGKL